MGARRPRRRPGGWAVRARRRRRRSERTSPADGRRRAGRDFGPRLGVGGGKGNAIAGCCASRGRTARPPPVLQPPPHLFTRPPPGRPPRSGVGRDDLRGPPRPVVSRINRGLRQPGLVPARPRCFLAAFFLRFGLVGGHALRYRLLLRSVAPGGRGTLRRYAGHRSNPPWSVCRPRYSVVFALFTTSDSVRSFSSPSLESFPKDAANPRSVCSRPDGPLLNPSHI